MKKCFLVTGAAGFIGAALVESLLSKGERVVGIDNLNSYYSTSLKLARLKSIEKNNISSLRNWSFHKISIEDSENLFSLFGRFLAFLGLTLTPATQPSAQKSKIRPTAHGSIISYR